MINSLKTTLIKLAHNKALLVVAFAICCLPSTAHAKAHCFCKLGPPASPIKDFGEIQSYNTQNGHDSSCSNLCDATTKSYMNDSGNRASACSITNGTTIVAYSAVGTKPYRAGMTYTCPTTNSGPAAGSIHFPPSLPGTARRVWVNDEGVDPFGQILPVKVPTQTAYTTFKLEDKLEFHVQKWTYDATLYRDNVLVERLSGKSPPASANSVAVTFTGQPNSAVHGHTWKVAWHYNGKNFDNGSVSFFIP
jgi:hypothetical protein